MTAHLRRRSLPLLISAAIVVLLAVPGRAFAEVCITIDEARDVFSPEERRAAVLLIEGQFEREGEQVVAPGCANAYVVAHVRLGNTITITLSGPAGRRDAVARGMDDILAVYSQMVRSLVRGVPMEAGGVTDRTNVTESQAAAANRVHSDSLFYARLGYGAVFGDRTYDGPSVGMIGYRREMDSFGVDVSFFNFQYKSSSRSYGYGFGGTSGSTGSWLKLEFLRFTNPVSSRSLYFGGGMSWGTASLDNDNTHWDGSGLQGELTAGYEIGRASSIRVFFQVDAGLPFYKLHGTSYPSYAPWGPVAPVTDDRYAPSATISLGIGWQRGGK